MADILYITHTLVFPKNLIEEVIQRIFERISFTKLREQLVTLKNINENEYLANLSVATLDPISGLTVHREQLSKVVFSQTIRILLKRGTLVENITIHFRIF